MTPLTPESGRAAPRGRGLQGHRCGTSSADRKSSDSDAILDDDEMAQRGNSHAGAQREFALANRGRRILERNTNVIDDELRVAGDDVGRRGPFRDERHDRRNRDSCAGDARDATHHTMVDADSLEAHRRNSTPPVRTDAERFTSTTAKRSRNLAHRPPARNQPVTHDAMHHAGSRRDLNSDPRGFHSPLEPRKCQSSWAFTNYSAVAC